MAQAYQFAALLICGLMSPAVLAQGNSGGNANSNSDSSSQSDGSQGGQRVSGNGNSAAPQSQPAQPHIPDNAEEEALRAVRLGQAVPLSRIVGVLERTNGSKVLDAKLVKAGNVLLYRLKLLSVDGKVTTEFYHAPTGQPVDRSR
jgi:hypothetical protein